MFAPKRCILLSLTTSLTIDLASSQPTCYWPDGTIAPDYAPCSTSGATSMCYYTPHADTCEPNGLILNVNGVYYRDACTDPTWKSPGCVLLCPWNTTYSDLLQCTDGSFCCGYSNTTCCASREGYYLASATPSIISTGLLPTQTSSAESTPSSTTSSSGATTTTNADGLSTASSNKSSNPNNLAIGLGVGLGSALLLVLSCGTWFWLRTKRREKGGSPSAPMKHDTKSEKEGNAAEEKMILDVTTHEMSGSGKSLVSDLNSKEERVPDIYVPELGGNVRPVGYELGSGSMARPNIDIPELGGNERPVAYGF